MTGRSPVFSSVRRAPRRRWWRSLGVLAAAVVVAVAAVAVLAAALWGYTWVRLGGDDLVPRADDAEALGLSGGTSPSGTTTWLVSLVEPIDPTLPEEPPLAASVAVVQVGGPRDAVAVLLLPPELPIDPDGTTLGDVQVADGTEGLAQAVLDYTGVSLDHAVTATTEALPGLVEARGPVPVCLAGGCRELDAAGVGIAVAQGDDTERVRTVVAVLRALAPDVDLLSALRSPLVTKRTVDVLADEVITDASLRGGSLIDLAAALESDVELDVATLPAVVHPGTGELVVLPERAEVVLQRLRDGTRLAGDGTDEDDEVPVADVEVAVLNGTGTAGLAARVQARLEAAGYTIVGTGNAPPYDYDTTRVVYGPDDPIVEAAAILLADELDGADLDQLDRQPTFEGEPVDVVVTAGFDIDDVE